ncbi:unnamed protein product [Didymodactylos carnosus]|uniref:Uncharacterized protein n=2 Tax=Didymodactylos carnosus TaxID=1234261 RepID=A0A813UDK0_9BILA|nr:unnamed protein product [Didymodactylos carnosus]CAF3614494.1 unnamed protein product [Didymodactylos carnosus]
MLRTRTFEVRVRAKFDIRVRVRRQIFNKVKNQVLSHNQKHSLPLKVVNENRCLNDGENVQYPRYGTISHTHWNNVAKDRELAKLKALIFQRDNDIIALTATHKNEIAQVEDRLQRERQVWNEHRDTVIANERCRFEEEKAHAIKDIQHELKLEQDRNNKLQQKLYDLQTRLSETQIMLKESAHERINAVFNTKELCRKEYQEEVNHLRTQLQMKKDEDLSQLQLRVKELEENLQNVSISNADTSIKQNELFINMITYEKMCVRLLHDIIKKLLISMDSSSHLHATIPSISSYTYDEESVVTRVPSRCALKILQDTVDDVNQYILEQRIQLETKSKFLRKANAFSDKTSHYANDNRNYHSVDKEKLSKRYENSGYNSKTKENSDSYYFRDVDRLANIDEQKMRNLQYQLTSKQNDTIDNLVQKLEKHIENELERLTKQRLTLSNNSSEPRSLNETNDHRPSSFIEPKKVKFESVEPDQETLIRHLQERITDLRDDNIRLRQQSRSTPSTSMLNTKIQLNDSNRYSSDNKNDESFNSNFTVQSQSGRNMT